MKVIIDTNVLISAAILGRKPEAVVLWVVNRRDVQWVVSEEILTEYKEVLSRPRFKLNPQQQERWFKVLEEATTVVTVEPEANVSKDNKDAKFLSCSLASQADFLITDDREFREAQPLTQTTIVSVALFQRLIGELDK
jgi:putative PIN family toxin of toxin-antitoxin system